MKILKIAAAVALVAAAAPSMAKITILAENTNELVLNVWSVSQQASYTQDLGLTLGAMLAGGMSNAGYSFSAAVTSTLTSQAALANASDLRWSVTVFDTAGDFQPDATRLLTTYNPATAPGGFVPTGPGSNIAAGPAIVAADIQSSQATWEAFISNVNQVGGHTAAGNGSSYSTPSTNALGYLLNFDAPAGNMQGFLQNFDTGLAQGASSNFYYFTGGDADFADSPAKILQFKNSANNGTWTFDGSTVSYTLAAAVPVPEPESYALMLAGLAALSMLAKRRNSRPDTRG